MRPWIRFAWLLLVASLAGHANAAAPNYRALLVGVSEYPALRKELQLQGPRNDVERMRQVLVARGLAPQSITVLADSPHEAAEPDGRFEIFLPRDVENWGSRAGDSAPEVRNAIHDHEIRAPGQTAAAERQWNLLDGPGLQIGAGLLADVREGSLPVILPTPVAAQVYPREAGGNNRLELGARPAPFDIHITDETLGTERLLVIGVEARKHGERADYAFLAEPTLEHAVITRGRGTDDDTAQLLRDAGFADYATRGVKPVLPPSGAGMQVFTWQVAAE